MLILSFFNTFVAVGETKVEIKNNPNGTEFSQLSPGCVDKNADAQLPSGIIYYN